MSNFSTIQIVSLIGGVLILGTVALFWIWYAKAGDKRNLARIVRNISLEACENIVVPDINGGTIYIDCLLLTPTRLLLLHLSDVTGAVIAGEKLNKWTVSAGGKAYTINNPVQRLLDQTAALSLIAPGADVETLVVFTREATFPKGHPDNVLSLEELVARYQLEPDAAAAEVYARHWDAIKAIAVPA